MIQPITPTEVIISRLPHRDGVNWVFHDPVMGSVWHVNVPYAHPLSQQSINQAMSQPGATNKMLLYQQPLSQTTMYTSQVVSASRPMALALPQQASAT